MSGFAWRARCGIPDMSSIVRDQGDEMMRRDATRSSTVPNLTRLIRRLPRLALVAAVGVLAACAAQDPLEEDLPDMGDFRLAHNIVVAENMQQVPPSRNATPEEWQEIITSEIDRRFGGYEGDRLYHIGINVDGYALAPPGIPDRVEPALGAGAVGQCLGRRSWARNYTRNPSRS
jgi:hypothetical protein